MKMIKKLMNTKGFTLVELLIVIAVIGILAIAVLAALDPIEQLKKSRDTGRLSDARELYNAYNRYYASYNCYPEERAGGTCANTEWPLETLNGATAATGETASGIDHLTVGITPMTTSGELKPAFLQKQTVTGGQLFVFQDAEDQVAVCFQPESKSARAGGMGTVLEDDMTTAGDCASVTGVAYDGSVLAQDCNLCVQ